MRENALLPTKEEELAARSKADSEALRIMLGSLVKHNRARAISEAALFEVLFKEANYSAGDIVFISTELCNAINFRCTQIKYSDYLSRNEYLVLNRTMTPRIIGGEA